MQNPFSLRLMLIAAFVFASLGWQQPALSQTKSDIAISNHQKLFQAIQQLEQLRSANPGEAGKILGVEFDKGKFSERQNLEINFDTAGFVQEQGFRDEHGHLYKERPGTFRKNAVLVVINLRDIEPGMVEEYFGKPSRSYDAPARPSDPKYISGFTQVEYEHKGCVTVFTVVHYGHMFQSIIAAVQIDYGRRPASTKEKTILLKEDCQ